MDLTFTSDISVTPLDSLEGDRLIARAAWAATGKDADTADDSEVGRLIRMLMKGRHGSPFEFGVLQFRVHAPLFVFRQWHRHRVGWSYAETSGRWHRPGSTPPLVPVFWIPRWERPMVTTERHKPSAPDLEPAWRGLYDATVDGMKWVYKAAWKRYELMLSRGITAEVARAVLPLATYSTCFMQCNPRSLMHFLSLRTHGTGQNPQAEIEEAALALERVFQTGWPLTYAAWVEFGRVAP